MPHHSSPLLTHTVAEALLVARRLAEIYDDRLYLTLAFHGSPSDKMLNRGLLAITKSMNLRTRLGISLRWA